MIRFSILWCLESDVPDVLKINSTLGPLSISTHGVVYGCSRCGSLVGRSNTTLMSHLWDGYPFRYLAAWMYFNTASDAGSRCRGGDYPHRLGCCCCMHFRQQGSVLSFCCDANGVFFFQFVKCSRNQAEQPTLSCFLQSVRVLQKEQYHYPLRMLTCFRFNSRSRTPENQASHA